jgi:hypothetical protein
MDVASSNHEVVGWVVNVDRVIGLRPERKPGSSSPKRIPMKEAMNTVYEPRKVIN